MRRCSCGETDEYECWKKDLVDNHVTGYIVADRDTVGEFLAIMLVILLTFMIGSAIIKCI